MRTRNFCLYVHSMNQTYVYSRYDSKIKFRMVSLQHFVNEAAGVYRCGMSLIYTVVLINLHGPCRICKILIILTT